MLIYLYINKVFLCVSKEKKVCYGMQVFYYNDSLIYFDNMMYLCIILIFFDFYKFCIYNIIMFILQ